MHISELPLELLGYIFSFVITLGPKSSIIILKYKYLYVTCCNPKLYQDYKDLQRLSKVCQQWSRVSNCDYLWKHWNNLINIEVKPTNFLETIQHINTPNNNIKTRTELMEFLSNNIQSIIYLDKRRGNELEQINEIRTVIQSDYKIKLTYASYEIALRGTNFH